MVLTVDCAAGLAEEASKCCASFEQEAASAHAQMAHAAEVEDHVQFEAAALRAQHFQQLSGDMTCYFINFQGR